MTGFAEDWHYVGAAGEPAFESGYDNGHPTLQNMGFRLREAGTVDLVGIIEVQTDTATHVVALGADYAMTGSTLAYIPTVYSRVGALHPTLIRIDGDGDVEVSGHSSLAGDLVYMYGSYFTRAS